MSKKDKDKRKKGDARSTPSAWIANLGKSAPPPPFDGPATTVERPAPRHFEAPSEQPSEQPSEHPSEAPGEGPRSDPREETLKSARALVPEEPHVDTKRSPLPPAQVVAVVTIPALAPISSGSFDFSPLERASEPSLSSESSESYDLSDETLGDIAPIGPTEYARLGEPPSLTPDSLLESDPIRPQAPSVPTSVEHLEQQIRDLEARLDEMIGARAEPSKAASTAPAAPSVPATSAASAAEPALEAIVEEAPRPSTATAREVLSSDFYLRQWGRAGMRKRAEEVDEYGHDPAYEARFLPFFDFLAKHYFRVDVEGTAHIPGEGRCLVVANHSGGPLPYDGIMLRTTLRREHEQHRELRWLAEDFIYYLPFVGSMMNRLGAVRACQENAERLLAQGRLVAVFPEGAKGIGKLYKERYKLQRFGRGGFIRLCLRTQTPLVPAAIVGAEEANPMLYRLEYMAKTLGIPYLPITPTFPALGPLGLLPAPTKWKIAFGEPMRFDSYGPEAADDDILVGRLAERVRATIQSMLDRMVSSRSSVWFG